jgi:hypothetical protein
MGIELVYSDREPVILRTITTVTLDDVLATFLLLRFGFIYLLLKSDFLIKIPYNMTTSYHKQHRSLYFIVILNFTISIMLTIKVKVTLSEKITQNKSTFSDRLLMNIC